MSISKRYISLNNKIKLKIIWICDIIDFNNTSNSLLAYNQTLTYEAFWDSTYSRDMT